MQALVGLQCRCATFAGLYDSDLIEQSPLFFRARFDRFDDEPLIRMRLTQLLLGNCLSPSLFESGDPEWENRSLHSGR
jgi:hypothetical protein